MVVCRINRCKCARFAYLLYCNFANSVDVSCVVVDVKACMCDSNISEWRAHYTPIYTNCRAVWSMIQYRAYNAIFAFEHIINVFLWCVRLLTSLCIRSLTQHKKRQRKYFFELLRFSFSVYSFHCFFPLALLLNSPSQPFWECKYFDIEYFSAFVFVHQPLFQ